MSKSDIFPCLPLRDIIVFPGMIVPLFVGRDKSIKALSEVMKTNKKIILITQKNAEIDDPAKEDLYSFGCESKILQLLKLPDGTVKVLVEGIDRVKILECKNDKEFLSTSVEVVKDKIDTNVKNNKISIIAEIKKASPSAGIIIKDYNPVNIAQIYNNNKATCLSVLTEEDFFLGNLIHISKIKQKINLPILCKDFFVDKFQLNLAKSYGADAILIILAGVSNETANKIMADRKPSD